MSNSAVTLKGEFEQHSQIVTKDMASKKLEIEELSISMIIVTLAVHRYCK